MKSLANRASRHSCDYQALHDIEISDDKSISVPLSSIRAKLENSVEKRHKDHWVELCGDLKVIVTTFYTLVFSKYLDTLDKLQFTSRTLSDITPQEGSILINGVITLIKKAGYEPLSQQRYKAALEVSFEFVLPCETDWEAVSHPLMSDFVLAYKDQLYPDHPLPEFVENGVLIFTRGTVCKEASGLYINEKLDILVEHYWNRITRWIARKRNKPIPPKRKWVPRPHSKLVQRKTLYQFMKEKNFSPLSLLYKATLSEPCFESLIIVHCNSPHRKKAPDLLSMERYTGIPFADLEAVLPLKSLSLRPFDRLMIAIQVITLLFFAITSVQGILHPDSSSDFMLMFGVVIAVIIRFNQIVVALQTMKRDYQIQRQTYLQQRRVAHGREVPSRLLEEVEEQELKEMMLAYYTLWTHGPMGQQQLDTFVEEFVKTEFDASTDFNVDSATTKLKGAHLVEEDKDGVLRCAMSPADFVKANPSLGRLQSLSLTEEYNALQHQQFVTDINASPVKSRGNAGSE